MGPRILVFLRKNPGATCTEIAAALGVKAAFVRPHLAELRSAGKLTSTGHTRGTRWARAS